MQKSELLNKLHGLVEYENITISEFILLAKIYDIEIKCIVKTPVKDVVIDKDICSELNELYYSMTCRQLITGNKTYQELSKIFKDIYVEIIFI